MVLLDLHMPVLDGLATTHRLRAEFPDVRILVLSMVDNERAIGQVLAAGAHGYVLKNAGHDEITGAVRAVAAGRRFLCSELGLSMLEKLLVGIPEPAARPTGGLTAREQEILQLVADGMTTAQIAEKLYTSPRTVETHRQNIMEKTGAKNTATLIKIAANQGLLK
ncbi:LuxR C-terminal-related transcriptional regulator [Hymenobacter sp. BRD67]|uniref:LuxR C-terminal-related transcriptional regulator n=1 Tax=Hymenobacter sp. BRD67 TaxID=2675877 RepID=UPI0020B6C1FE|nr:response regulator transcription factor [Hymenobacter sp. BRD67]